MVGDVGKEKQDAAELAARTFKELASEAADAGNAQDADAYNARAAVAQKDANDWGDDGVKRIALHALTQGVIGGLTGGGTGALNSVAGVAGGTLGQQLGEELGKAEAENLHLKGHARQDLINTFQQTFATAGGAIAGLASASANGQGSANALSSALHAGKTAFTVDTHNRQLHKSEVEKLSSLKQGKSAEAQRRLDAAACSLVRCSEGVPTDDPLYAPLSALQKEGQNYKSELSALQATGEFFYQPTLDKTRDLITAKAEFFQRAGGAINLASGTIGMVGGGVMVVGGLTTCGPSAGLGCGVAAAGGYIAKESNSQAQQGNEALWATFKSSEGQQVLNSFNLRSYPGEVDPLKQTGLDFLMLGAGSVAGKILPSALSSAEKSLAPSKAPLTLAPSAGSASAKVAVAPINTVATTAKDAKDYGVTFFGDDILGFFGASKTTIGNPNGAPSFFMSLQDSALIKNAHDQPFIPGWRRLRKKHIYQVGTYMVLAFPLMV